MTSMSSYLAFDIATSTGWASGAPNTRPAHGSFECHAPPVNTDTSKSFARFGNYVDNILKIYAPWVVGIEQPIIQPTDNWSDVFILTGRVAVCEMLCANRGIPTRRYPNRTWRNAFLGKMAPDLSHLKGKSEKLRAERRKLHKEAVMRVCRLHGWAPRNDDEADALGILHYMLSTERT